MDHAKAVRILTVLMAVAITVSIVHYADNTINYSEYPADGPVPDPPQFLVGLSWFLFTGAGIAGYLMFRREPSNASLILLAIYSGSGLVGFLHYSVPGATDMPLWRQAHIWADIACGLAIIGFVLWAASKRPAPPGPARRGSSATPSG